MKKFSVAMCLLAITFLLTSCAKKVGYSMAIAMPFSSEQMDDMGLKESDDNYRLENVQVYKQADGNKAVYLYSAPIEQSSNMIIEGKEAYVAEGAFFYKAFPRILSNDSLITISSDINFAKIYLQDRILNGMLEDRQNVFGLNKQAVAYKNAFENGEDYICYPTSFGVNTEIIIPEKTGKSKFEIRIQLPNLVPDAASPDYILFKSALETGEVKSIIYTPLIVDKNGKWSYANKVRLTEKDVEKNTYTVEYTADEAFLNDESTVYPVTMNQSIYLYKAKQPDTSAYEKTGDEAGHYLSPYILLGDNTLKGEGWTYVRYETLNNMDIDYKKIVSVKYVFHNLFDLKDEAIVSAYAVEADWCSINTRWFNRPPFDERPVSKVTVKAAGDYKLDITALFIEMIKNIGKEDAVYSIQNSFMIRSDTEGGNIVVASGDNGLFSPVLEIVMSG